VSDRSDGLVNPIEWLRAGDLIERDLDGSAADPNGSGRELRDLFNLTTGRTPEMRHPSSTPLAPQFGSAAGAMPLNWRAPLDDLMAAATLEQGDLQPLTGAGGAGERDFARGLASRTQ
jgi:hypothetical protein